MNRSREGRRTLVLALLACLLGGYTYLTAPKKNILTVSATTKTERLIFTFDADKITRVEITYDGKQIVGDRTAQGWQSPAGTALPSSAVDDFLVNLTKIVNLGEVEQGRDDKLADYGLEPPVSQITVKIEGEGTQSLAVGRHNPVNTSLYALINQQPKIVLIGSIISWELRKLMEAVQSTANAG